MSAMRLYRSGFTSGVSVDGYLSDGINVMTFTCPSESDKAAVLIVTADEERGMHWKIMKCVPGFKPVDMAQSSKGLSEMGGDKEFYYIRKALCTLVNERMDRERLTEILLEMGLKLEVSA